MFQSQTEIASYNYRGKEFVRKLDRLKLEKETLLQSIAEVSDAKAKSIENTDLLEQCRDLLVSVNVLLHEKTQGTIESLVTNALQVIFGAEYRFKMVSSIKRNNAEVEFFVEQSGQLRSLSDELGGGIIDVVSFVLRVVVWSLQTPRTSNLIILDEPGKFLSTDKQPLFGQLLRDLSDKLEIQFVIVSHEEDLIEAADIAYRVVLKDGISQVRKV